MTKWTYKDLLEVLETREKEIELKNEIHIDNYNHTISLIENELLVDIEIKKNEDPYEIYTAFQKLYEESINDDCFACEPLDGEDDMRW